MDKALTCSLSAKTDEADYSLIFDGKEDGFGRMTIYRWHGTNYESVSWSGDIDDFQCFGPNNPGDWFETAADIIKGKVI